MKKMMKFLIGAAATGAAIAGTFYVIEKYFNKDESEDFDEEEFEDVFADEVDDREYVTLDLPATRWKEMSLRKMRRMTQSNFRTNDSGKDKRIL